MNGLVKAKSKMITAHLTSISHFIPIPDFVQLLNREGLNSIRGYSTESCFS